ncbi:DUF6799 domain-containing protein [Hymenobacter latericus]|uniref:DUF6799 domain-containing protein n=1 Tax=Hymenobacter sp. YIM 151858-1 TaxID=2987688 RepID=UPI002226F6D0|nr:DUF6799 domain-containing protein [Hymenobacter sp. YIM 151858-1]UYZ60998.1 hypothetical protein OIS50_09370 [Hymenobacter sp. YIM 151858-1]
MKQLTSLLLAFGALLTTASAVQAQNTPGQTQAAQQDNQRELQNTDQFVMQNGSVVKRSGTKTTGLSQNVRLPNGTKVNVKSGIVELPGGKITTLKEGDYVRADGSIVYATPQSAAAARGETAPADAKFGTLDQGAVPSTAEAEQRIADLGRRVELMAQKLQLLNQKISLLSQGHPKLPDTSQLDSQIKALDEQMRNVK